MNLLDTMRIEQVERYQQLRTKSLFSMSKSRSRSAGNYHAHGAYYVEPGCWDGFSSDAEVDEFAMLEDLYSGGARRGIRG